MSTLNVPQQQQASDKKVSHSGSASSLRPSGIEHTDDLAPVSRSRRNSKSNSGNTTSAAGTVAPGAPGSAAAQAGLIPLPQGPMQTKAENASLTSPVDWKEPDQLQATDPHSAMTAIYVGKDKKPFHIHTSTLVEKSPYFKKMLAEDASHAGSKSTTVEQTTFPDCDEFGTALFMHWIMDHGHLNGPHDFHSLAHYLSLYVLARKFGIEDLENQGKPLSTLRLFATRGSLANTLSSQSWTSSATTTPSKT